MVEGGSEAAGQGGKVQEGMEGIEKIGVCEMNQEFERGGQEMGLIEVAGLGILGWLICWYLIDSFD